MLQDLVLDQQKIEGLIERANGLVAEERFRDAEEAATVARNMAPNVPALASAVLTMRNLGYTEDMKKVVERRWKGVVDALYQVELSHIPTPDEPPIVYPDAETWIQMTERRRHWKEQISLAKPGSSEEKINVELNKKTDCDFTETPLADVIDYFKSKHEIEIQLDLRALQDEAIDSSVPITRQLKGITLKSTLRLILGELNLTYIIKDEVLLITTKTVADADTPTRVYPVADLVIPIRSGGLSGFGGLGGAPEVASAAAADLAAVVVDLAAVAADLAVAVAASAAVAVACSTCPRKPSRPRVTSASRLVADLRDGRQGRSEANGPEVVACQRNAHCSRPCSCRRGGVSAVETGDR